MEDNNREYSSGEIYRIMLDVRSHVKSLEDKVENSESALRNKVDAVHMKASVLEERLARMSLPAELITESISKAAILEERLKQLKPLAEKVPVLEQMVSQLSNSNAVWRAALASGTVTLGIILIQYVLTRGVPTP